MRRSHLPFLATLGCLYAAFLALDLLRPGSGWDVPLKYAAIILCFLKSLGCPQNTDGLLARWALGLTLAADLFLLVLDRWYPAGVAAFCGAQALYLVRMARLRPEGLPLRLVLRGCAAAAALVLVWHLGALDGLTALSLLYFSQLACNAMESLSLPALRGFSLGLLLFLCCDVCVGLRNLSAWFPSAAGPLVDFARVGMWLFYLPSQVLIALSVNQQRK